MQIRILAFVAALSITAMSCTEQGGQQRTEQEPKFEKTAIKYRIQPVKGVKPDSIKAMFTEAQLPVIMAVNRVDKTHMLQVDSLVVPDKFESNLNHYSPFPYYVAALSDIRKIIFFSYPAQAFGAYENGKLVRWGPTNMGREKDQTPTGLFFTNWKAEETVSTVDDEWILKWNFNIANKEGVGWHLYDMPGYPASHSCLRLLIDDAKYLYDWADEWKLEGTDNIKAYGTPVIVFGSYPFGGQKPWYALANNADALDISKETIAQLVNQHKQEMLNKQKQREALAVNKQ